MNVLRHPHGHADGRQSRTHVFHTVGRPIVEFPESEVGVDASETPEPARRSDQAPHRRDADDDVLLPEHGPYLRGRFYPILQGQDPRSRANHRSYRLCRGGHVPRLHTDDDDINDSDLLRVVCRDEGRRGEVTRGALHEEAALANGR